MAVLNDRPRVALGLPHLFQDLTVLALEAAIDGGVVAIIRSASTLACPRSYLPNLRDSARI
jgi:hypothetical protein